MNITKNKLTLIVIISALLLPVSTTIASSNPPLKIEIGTSSSTKITNMVATVQDDSILISGKMKRTKRTHRFIPGKVKIELFDSTGALFKTVNLSHKKHRHHVYKPFKFTSKINLDSHEVSKIIMTHK